MELALRFIAVIVFLFLALMGWMMFQRVSQRFGSLCLACSLVFLSTLSLCPWQEPHEIRKPIAHIGYRLPLTPVTTTSRFVGSRSGKLFHEAWCYRVDSIVGPVWYVSEEQAAADGKVHCLECLP